MKKIILFTLIFGTVLFSCRSTKNKDDGKLYIQDRIAYELDPDKFYTDLPDSLGGEDLHGGAAVEVYIDRHGEYLGFNLIKLSLKNKSGIEKTSFFNPNSPLSNRSEINSLSSLIIRSNLYPKEIRKYYRYIQSYLETLNYKRVEQVEPEAITAYSFLLRFNIPVNKSDSN